MSLLFQVFVNIIFFVAILILYVKMLRVRRGEEDSQRFYQGVQSKIAVLEDLSDRIERQFEQFKTLSDKKNQQLSAKMGEADQKVIQIENSMRKSLEVANIFQDKIPHQEIIKRKNSIKYYKAARLAHSGKSAQEISAELGLPMGEVEMITELNKDTLQFERPKYFIEDEVGSEPSSEATQKASL